MDLKYGRREFVRLVLEFGIELTYPGINGPNLYTKEVPMAATAGPILTFTSDPVNARGYIFFVVMELLQEQ